MSDTDMKNPKLALIFRYGKLTMQWTLTRDTRIRDELRKIEKDLGMTTEEIMDEAMRNTDRFRQHHQPAGHGTGGPEETPDTSGQ